MGSSNQANPPTAEKVRQFLSYDPETGLFRWLTSRNGSKAGSFAGSYVADRYVRIRLFGRLYLGHRLAWLLMRGEWPAADIDHINRIKGDNRWSNLRAASRSENLSNRSRHVNNTTGVPGVYFVKGSKSPRWFAHIRINTKCIFLGVFPSIEQAAAARKAAEALYFGQFAPTKDSSATPHLQPTSTRRRFRPPPYDDFWSESA